MKVFWAWQSDHPRRISRDVIRTALEDPLPIKSGNYCPEARDFI